MQNKEQNQLAFNTMVTHLRAQGKRSMGPSGLTCAYRDPKGGMCAVGVLIPDAQYEPAIEGSSVSMLLDKTTAGYKARISGSATVPVAEDIPAALHGLHIPLMQAMQKIHDLEGRPDGEKFNSWVLGTSNPTEEVVMKEWELCFANVAHRFDLTVPAAFSNAYVAPVEEQAAECVA